MLRKSLILVIVFFSLCVLFSQDVIKMFYDENWILCDSSRASYFRLWSVNEDGKYTGILKDYYITGEIQGTGFYSKINIFNDSHNVQDGVFRWYYKNGQLIAEKIYINGKEHGFVTGWYENGNKSAEVNYVNGKEHGLSIYWYENGHKKHESNYVNGVLHGLVKGWYENGNKESEFNYRNGVIHGPFKVYHDNGKAYRKSNMENGSYAEIFYMECDEFGFCQNIFIENFDTTSFYNHNEWGLHNDSVYSIQIVPDRGLLIKNSNQSDLRSDVCIPLKLENDFSIETSAKFIDGHKLSGYGLLWGYKDWDNYSCFLINANGTYSIFRIKDGIKIDIVDWEMSDQLITGEYENKLKIIREANKYLFAVNRKIIYECDFFPFNGNNIGFYVATGGKEVLFTNLIVKQSVENE